MLITICGSMSAAKEMIKAKEGMEKLGHEVIIQDDIYDFAEGRVTDDEKWNNLDFNPLVAYYPNIQKSDGILVVNIEKHGIDNYIGGSTLMEIGLASVNGKKIFILNDLPDMKYTEDIEACNPIILKGDLTNIK